MYDIYILIHKLSNSTIYNSHRCRSVGKCNSKYMHNAILIAFGTLRKLNQNKQIYHNITPNNHLNQVGNLFRQLISMMLARS